MKTYGIPVRKLNCHICSSLTLFFSWDSMTAVLIFSISLSLSLRACLNCCSSPSFPCKARTFSSAATYNYDQTIKNINLMIFVPKCNAHLHTQTVAALYFTELSKYGISDKKIETMFPLSDFQGATLDDKFKVAHAIKKEIQVAQQSAF